MANTVSFIKMHGIGNDYVYINAMEQTISNAPELAKRLSHRHFGIGADGLVLIAKSAKADAKMIMYNADGTESENCGNALRCIAKYLYDEHICRRSLMRIETLSGIYDLNITPDDQDRAGVIKVNLGKPSSKSSDISPTFGAHPMINHPFDFGFAQFKGTLVSIGNPHIVIYVDNTGTVPIEDWGPKIENHPAFADRINIEFVQIINRGKVIQRTWERGSGETWACGTGAAAVCVAGVLTKNTDSRMSIQLKGGALDMEWQGQEHPVFMSGPAVEVFRGEVFI